MTWGRRGASGWLVGLLAVLVCPSLTGTASAADSTVRYSDLTTCATGSVTFIADSVGDAACYQTGGSTYSYTVQTTASGQLAMRAYSRQPGATGDESTVTFGGVAYKVRWSQATGASWVRVPIGPADAPAGTYTFTVLHNTTLSLDGFYAPVPPGTTVSPSPYPSPYASPYPVVSTVPGPTHYAYPSPQAGGAEVDGCASQTCTVKLAEGTSVGLSDQQYLVFGVAVALLLFFAVATFVKSEGVPFLRG